MFRSKSQVYSLQFKISSLACAIGMLTAALHGETTSSPIMKLEDVIGIEIQRSNLGERAMQEGTQEQLFEKKPQVHGFSLIRKFDPLHVKISSAGVNTDERKWLGISMAVQKKTKSPPAVLLLDGETGLSQSTRYRSRKNSKAALKRRAFLDTPLASHLLGYGFTVAFPNANLLESEENPFEPAEWLTLIELLESKAHTDPQSLFLVATREYAELALRLAAMKKKNFAGVVIEAPSEMMFREESAKNERNKRKALGISDNGASKTEYESTPFESNSQVELYLNHASAITEPIQVMLAEDAPNYERTKKTLVTALAAANAKLSVVVLGSRARIGFPEGEFAGRSKSDPSRNDLLARYDIEQFGRWMESIEQFLITHSKTKPWYLPLPKPHDTQDRTDLIHAQF